MHYREEYNDVMIKNVVCFFEGENFGKKKTICAGPLSFVQLA